MDLPSRHIHGAAGAGEIVTSPQRRSCPRRQGLVAQTGHRATRGHGGHGQPWTCLLWHSSSPSSPPAPSR